MLNLPPRHSDLRNCFDMEQLANQEWITKRDMMRSASAFYQANRWAEVSPNYLHYTEYGEVQLVTVNRSLEINVLWMFGNY